MNSFNLFIIMSIYCLSNKFIRQLHCWNDFKESDWALLFSLTPSIYTHLPGSTCLLAFSFWCRWAKCALSKASPSLCDPILFFLLQLGLAPESLHSHPAFIPSTQLFPIHVQMCFIISLTLRKKKINGTSPDLILLSHSLLPFTGELFQENRALLSSLSSPSVHL